MHVPSARPSEEGIARIQQLIFDTHGVEISHAEAEDGLARLILLVSCAREVEMAQMEREHQLRHLPLGWRVATDAEGRRFAEPDPKTAPLVAEARELRAQGISIRKICAVMEAKGLRSRRGKVIGPSSMVKVLNVNTIQ